MKLTSNKMHVLPVYLVLALGTLIAFEQVRQCEFTATDDGTFAARNHIAGLECPSLI